MNKFDVINTEWNNFSVIEISKDKYVLILLCKEKHNAQLFYSLLATNNYDLTVRIKDNKTYNITVDFIDTDYKLFYDTKLTVLDYPPLEWLASSKVKLLTTGIKHDDGMMYWDDNYLDLLRPLLN